MNACQRAQQCGIIYVGVIVLAIGILFMILAWADQSWNARSKCRRTRVWAAMVYG